MVSSGIEKYYTSGVEIKNGSHKCCRAHPTPKGGKIPTGYMKFKISKRLFKLLGHNGITR
jgi:hypothetical protein